MFILITGGSKSGKSKLAEDIIKKYSEGLISKNKDLHGENNRNNKSIKKYYIATMEPFTEEAKLAIERHREQRKDDGYITIEKYKDIHEIDLAYSLDSENQVALLECVGNLLANEMFMGEYRKECSEKIIQDIGLLSEKVDLLITVTNEVGSDGYEYQEETKDYIKNLGRINAGLSKIADVVIESCFSIPIVLKGDIEKI